MLLVDLGVVAVDRVLAATGELVDRGDHGAEGLEQGGVGGVEAYRQRQRVTTATTSRAPAPP